MAHVEFDELSLGYLAEQLQLHIGDHAADPIPPTLSVQWDANVDDVPKRVDDLTRLICLGPRMYKVIRGIRTALVALIEQTPVGAMGAALCAGTSPALVSFTVNEQVPLLPSGSDLAGMRVKVERSAGTPHVYVSAELEAIGALEVAPLLLALVYSVADYAADARISLTANRAVYDAKDFEDASCGFLPNRRR